ncbi:rCG57018 [Rattus norvegicus]|uniref:RCG57018 n=1 Tax=Rattus norvegicus TaxID=10116 RepID=A6JD09_RAT|nr:rCG57018 [Rattus norvegicus]
MDAEPILTGHTTVIHVSWHLSWSVVGDHKHKTHDSLSKNTSKPSRSEDAGTAEVGFSILRVSSFLPRDPLITPLPQGI